MTKNKLITICQYGGKFETSQDGSLSYIGGEAHAIDIDHETQFKDFKLEIVDLLKCDTGSMSIKYFLTGNRKTLITVSNDKDLKRMITFNKDSTMVDVYIIPGEMVVADASNMHGSRSSRTTLSETTAPVDIVSESIVPVDTGSVPVNIGAESIVPVDIRSGSIVPVDIKSGSIVPADIVVNDASEALIGIDSTPVALASVSNNPKPKIISSEWEVAITGVKQRFNSVHEFREALRKYAIAHGFACKYQKNDSHRVTVKCKAEGCPWRLHASRLSTTQLFCIKRMNPTHTCERSVLASGTHALTNWVADTIKDKLRDSPHYRPKDVVDDIKRDYKIELNYSQAWRAKEIAREKLQGSYKDAYNQLPFLCERILESNPGSFATFSTKADSSFHHLFIALHASVHGFQQGCRPLLFLDSTPLNSKYRGSLLTATAADGNDDIFPVAFAIVDAVSVENWRWFVIELKSAVSASQSITFVADMEKGIKESIAETFENGHHAYCIRYLTEKFKKELPTHFSNEVKCLLVDDFSDAAHALKYEGFEKNTESIKSISPEAYNWVVQSQPVHWANVFFEGARYNHTEAKFGESFYTWLSQSNELPITQTVNMLRCKMMEMMNKRREDSNEWLTTRLTPLMEEKLQKETLKAHSVEVLYSPSNGTNGIFDVRGSSIEKVDINRWACSCKGWQITGLPCCHAIAVFACIGRNTYDYCSRYFTTESYRITYSKSILPVPDVGHDSPRATMKITPPPVRRPPGRPKEDKTALLRSDKRKFQCTNCKGSGHNRLTCKESI